MVPSLSSFLFCFMAGTTESEHFFQLNIVDSCKTQRCHQSVFGWDSKRETHTPGKRSHMGEKATSLKPE